MRFLYKILIGLIIFNSMLVLLAGFFTIQGVPPTESGSAVNVTSDTDFTDYEITGGFFALDTLTVSVFGIAFGLGILFGWVLKSPIPIAAGLFSGFISAIYIRSASVINNIIPSGNWIISSIVGLVGIIIGILAAITIIEMFAQQTGAD